MDNRMIMFLKPTVGVPHLIKLNKDDKQRADSFARAFVARYLNLVEDCIANGVLQWRG